MKNITTIKDMQAWSRKLRSTGKRIGFIPTMGALHDGHLSLARRSKEENDLTVVSIFVNPTQFGPKEDFSKYPRDLSSDIAKLSPLNIDAVFTPDAREMYPDGFSTSISIGHIGEVLCGASRPGHFNGVATVVAKLFNIVMPDKAYFGQKDFQQTVVIRKLKKELNFDIDIAVCPTIRERDGLAMSSRNAFLSAEERKTSTILHRALKLGEDLIVSKKTTDADKIKEKIKQLINSETSVIIDYVEIVDVNDLANIKEVKPPVALCLAVKIGTTRLIDNIIVGN